MASAIGVKAERSALRCVSEAWSAKRAAISSRSGDYAGGR